MHHIRTLYANRWIRYGLTAVLLALVAWKAQPARLENALSTVMPGYLLLAAVLTLPFLYLKALRWMFMLRAADVRASFGEAALSLVGGMGLALITPARLGELIRGAYLRDGSKLKISGLVMIDKGFDVLVLAALSIAGAWILLSPLAGVALALVSIAGLLAVYNARIVSTVLHSASARLPLRERLESIWSSTSCLSARTTSIFLLLTLLSFGVVLLQFGIILLSWSAWRFDIVFLTFPLVILTNVLPVTIGGLGVREAAAALLLSHYGISPAHAALAAFLMFFLNTALPGIAGALVLPAANAPKAQAPSLDRL